MTPPAAPPRPAGPNRRRRSQDDVGRLQFGGALHAGSAQSSRTLIAPATDRQSIPPTYLKVLTLGFKLEVPARRGDCYSGLSRRPPSLSVGAKPRLGSCQI